MFEKTFMRSQVTFGNLLYLFKFCILAPIFVIFVPIYSGTVPKKCYKSRSLAYCYPYIPSFLHIFGWDLSGVTTFRLYASSSFVWTLHTLPNDIFEMASDITNLYMNNAGLEILPCDVFNPLKNSLKRIYLNGNLFREFPICALQKLEALEYMEMENQQLTSFQADRISWNSIRSIFLRNNELSIFNISNINNEHEISIYLDNNKIYHLQLLDTNHIRYLSAKNNLIRNVHVNIFRNSKTSLTYLDLSQNKLDNYIWDDLADITSLQTLKLNNNQISLASAFVLNSAKNLVHLDLSNNQLTSLAGVTLRSGKLRYLYLGSNRLTEIGSFLTSSTETFDGSPQQYDLSNNSIAKIDISIPLAATSLTLRLDKNRLQSVNFDSNKIKLGTFNISHNDLHFLPYYLPKANTYVLSSNPLNTTDVIKKLTNEMREALVIEMENISLFCGKGVSGLPTINNTHLRSLNLKHKCVPLDIICHIHTSCSTLMSLYLDNNTATQLSCSLRNKCFDVLSLNQCDLNDIISKRIVGDPDPNYFKSILARQNNVSIIPLIQNTLNQRDADISYDMSMNQITVLEGFNISAYKLNLDFKDNKLSSIKQGHLWPLSNIFYLTLSFANNSLVKINDGLVNIYLLRKGFFYAKISIDLSYNFVKELSFKNFIQFQTKLDRITFYFQLNINLSYNSIQYLEDCLELDEHFNLRLTLDLSFNNITTLPNTSCGMAYNMYLGYNKIRRISTPIPQAETNILDLQWNTITEIHMNAFDNLTKLRELNLRGNMIDVFPSSVTTLKLLAKLDISFNRIKHISSSDFKNLKQLQKLIITDNSFFVSSTDLQLSKHKQLEANEIYCDCKMMFLRNQSFSPQFRLTGRCTSPPEYEGYHISCFPVSQCFGVVALYITRTIVETCQNDKFYNITMKTMVISNTIIINTRIIGQRKPKHLSMQAFRNGERIKQVQLNITGRSNLVWLDRNLGPNELCFLSVFDHNDTLLHCFPVKIKSKYTNDKMGDNNGTFYGISSMLVLSLFVNIFIGIFTLISCRNKRKKLDEQHLPEENNIETYEITSIADNTFRGSLAQPVYEDIPTSKEHCFEHAYSNLALDA